MIQSLHNLIAWLEILNVTLSIHEMFDNAVL